MKNIVWLKEQIWTTHESFENESNFVKKLRVNEVSLDDYAFFLKSIYDIVKKVEEYVREYWNIDFGFLKDLEDELSTLPNQNIKNENKIILNSKYEVLGALYALNGSMKGGIYMKNILSKNPQFYKHSFKYYRQRDDNSIWIENMIDNTIFNDVYKYELVAGAKSVFETLNKNQI